MDAQNEVRTAARFVTRRMNFTVALREFGRALLCAGGALMVVGTLHRIAYLPGLFVASLVTLPAAALIAGAVLAVRHQPSLLDGALEIDRRLGLAERLSSAVALTESAVDTPAARAVIADAASRVAGADLDRAHPFVAPRALRMLPLLGIVLAAVFGFVPPMDLLDRGDPRVTVRSQDARVRVVALETARAARALEHEARAAGLMTVEQAAGEAVDTARAIRRQPQRGAAQLGKLSAKLEGLADDASQALDSATAGAAPAAIDIEALKQQQRLAGAAARAIENAAHDYGLELRVPLSYATGAGAAGGAAALAPGEGAKVVGHLSATGALPDNELAVPVRAGIARALDEFDAAVRREEIPAEYRCHVQRYFEFAESK